MAAEKTSPPYREEREEQPAPAPRVVHEWHILPKLRKLTAEDGKDIMGHFLIIGVGTVVALLVISALFGVAVAGCYFYDWRMGRH